MHDSSRSRAPWIRSLAAIGGWLCSFIVIGTFHDAHAAATYWPGTGCVDGHEPATNKGVLGDCGEIEQANWQNEIFKNRKLNRLIADFALYQGARFSGVEMQEARLLTSSGTRSQFEDSNLLAISLRGSFLRQASFQRTNLERADLRGIKADGLRLFKCDLRNARLQGAYLTFASILDSDLRGADLRDAVLTGANLRGSIYDEATRLPFSDDVAVRYGLKKETRAP